MSILQTLPQAQQDLITRHLDLVIEANKATNLTRIDTREEALVLHVEDSLSALEELNGCPEGPYADMGSGAGYPGIPLAIASGRETTLIDARQKKMIAVGEIIRKLGLEQQITTYAGRAELLARKKPKHYTAITARALAKLPVLMELASPLLQKGGWLICYKANLDESELAHAGRVRKATGMKLVSQREFQLENVYNRAILTFQKVSEPTVKLPRQEGQAQKNPLG